jgi:hypothetical protein
MGKDIMKTKLEYEFKDNEDDSRFYMITNGENFYFALWDLDQELRDIVKHDRSEELGLDADTLDHVRGMIREFMEEHGVDFEHVS